MIHEDEALEISKLQSKLARDERLAREKGMIRLFTINEEQIMKEGFVNIEDKE
jgi:hypothetical protein